MTGMVTYIDFFLVERFTQQILVHTTPGDVGIFYCRRRDLNWLWCSRATLSLKQGHQAPFPHPFHHMHPIYGEVPNYIEEIDEREDTEAIYSHRLLIYFFVGVGQSASPSKERKILTCCHCRSMRTHLRWLISCWVRTVCTKACHKTPGVSRR